MIIDPGKRAEYLLAHKALEYNMMVLWPSSEVVPYDLVIDTGSSFIKVQVKATYGKASQSNSYQIRCSKSSEDRKYVKGDFDVLAVFIAQMNAWYLLPFEVVEGKTSLLFYPHRPGTGQFEHSRDAWHLLKGK